MRPTQPYIEVPGDNDDEMTLTNGGILRPRIMARSGDLLAVRKSLAVWRFGFAPDSEAARAYGVCLDDSVSGLVWVLSTVKTAKVLDTFHGFAFELPPSFTRIFED